MPAQLINSAGCCVPCDSEPLPVQIPGPQGPAGADGTDGTDGTNAFTTTVGSFVVPPQGSNVTFTVAESSFIPLTAYLAIGSAGYFSVQNVVGNLVTVQNPASGSMGSSNVIPGTVIASGTLVSVAGAIGAPGINGTSGAPVSAKYVVLEPDASLTDEVALSAYTAGYMKTGGSTGVPLGVIQTTPTIPVADISGTLPLGNGGTGLSSTPTNGQVPIGNGTGYTLATLTAGSGISISNASGSITISASASTTSELFTARLSAPVNCATGADTNIFTGIASSIDSQSGWDSANGQYEIQSDGFFRISFLLVSQSVSGNQQVTMRILKNGSLIGTYDGLTVTTTPYHPVNAEFFDSASIGDLYKVEVNVAAGAGSLNALTYSSFSVFKIS